MTRREGKVGIVTEKRLMPLGQISQQSDADWWLISASKVTPIGG
jgi:hypothetical protein